MENLSLFLENLSVVLQNGLITIWQFLTENYTLIVILIASGYMVTQELKAMDTKFIQDNRKMM